MGRTLRTLRIVQLMMLGSILLYAVVGELAGPGTGAANPALSYIFTSMGVAIVGVIFVVRRTLVLRSAETLAANPDDELTLNHWKTGYVATYALCEALAVFGIVLRFMGFTLQQSLPFYAGGLVLLFFFSPRQPTAS